MKKLSVSCALALVGSMWIGSSSAASANTVSWLAGCWSLEGSEPGTLEVWMKPAGGVMVGMSRTIRNGAATAHEFMLIRSDGDSLVFVAQPSNQREAKFIAARIAEREVIFENLAHDFPQRILYRRSGDDTLHARIEGVRDGKLRGIDYSMTKVACE